MKLWLDDIRPSPPGWHWARSVDEAIHIMNYYRLNEDGSREYPNKQNFEACSLGHDLGAGEAKDGIRFVDWMNYKGIWPHSKPVVHSMNSRGRKLMELTINRYWLPNFKEPSTDLIESSVEEESIKTATWQTALLAEIRRKVTRYLDPSQGVSADEVFDLCENFRLLDTSLSSGELLPDDWVSVTGNYMPK